jgi:hypothetical protein
MIAFWMFMEFVFFHWANVRCILFLAVVFPPETSVAFGMFGAKVGGVVSTHQSGDGHGQSQFN